MEAGQPWLGIAIGTSLGIAYVAAGFYSNKWALRNENRFMLVVVATMVARIFVALIFLIGILLLLPVSATAFLGSFFVTFIIGLIAEVLILHRRAPAVRDNC